MTRDPYLPPQGHPPTDYCTTCYTYLCDDDRSIPDLDIVSDMDEVVDLDILTDLGRPYRPPIDRRIRPDLAIRSADTPTYLWDLLVHPIGADITETIDPYSLPTMDYRRSEERRVGKGWRRRRWRS